MKQLSLQEVLEKADKLTTEGKNESAIALYKQWLSHKQAQGSPARHLVLFNLGVLSRSVGKVDEAIGYFQQTLTLKPEFYQAAANLGLAFEAKGDFIQATQTWLAALQPADAQTLLLNHIGRLMEVAFLFDDAEKYYIRSLVNQPDQPNTLQHYLLMRQRQCKWPVVQAFPFLSEDSQWNACGPLSLMALTDDPARQQRGVQQWVARHLTDAYYRISPEAGYQHDKIRIGYMSCDFRSHAVSILTAGLYELHDREKFEVYAIDFTPERVDTLRQRVLAAMDHHLPIHTLSDEQAAQLICQHEIDILIDLTGLTLGSRAGILRYKPAPIQVSYLGFVGTCGIPEVDYIIADRFVFPDALKPYFTEQPLYLPKVYQANDSNREVGETPSREACNLPDDAFVFCSFNGSYKITPDVFACWMRILKRVPNSVLWIVADNPTAPNYIRNTAAQHGVASERIVFAERAFTSEYLARYKVANLFLDTSPYNAGTTASDALWIGLPVLTCPGRTFASRMAGALLTSINMPELIADTWAEYEEKAVALATQPGKYAQLCEQLKQNRDNGPLFDTQSFVRDFEQMLLTLKPDVSGG